ncbi:anti-sigma factor [Pseudomonas cavernae]|uniref:Anti-sigma factor n=1 Tax=Pseudomonas cavernae TaxID=2320867 RepID=A0A385Z2N6_9PSED|nr:anti-sigma factor [Pseudomonas cavernae]AYC32941.1 anti-sigma factor [Pseudomonas cavernae]
MNTLDEPGEDDDELRIAEYVLGVLDAPERKAIETLIASDVEFADRYAAWQERLAPLASEIEPVATPDYLWSSIAAQLHFPAAPTPQRVEPAPTKLRFWDSLVLWRWLTAGGFALTLLLGSLLLLNIRPATDTTSLPALTATLQLESGQAVFTTSIDTLRQRIIVIPSAPVELAGRVAELWLIAPGQKPYSLGLLAADRAITLPIPPDIRSVTQPQAVFAISLEPPGGSPTGQPTGPVIAKGEIFSL